MELNEVVPPGTDDAFTVQRRGEGRLADLDDSHRRLLDGPHPAALATLNTSGTVQLSPVWLLHDGENLLINSVRGRLKDRNLRRRPQVSICIVDPENQYHYVSIQGTVIQVIDEDDPDEGNRATQVIDEMAALYMGVNEYPLRAPSGEVRSLFIIRPDRVSTFN